MFETRKEEASVEEIRELKERLERERPVEWEAFPDIGLYMDQLISYMPRQLIHYGAVSYTHLTLPTTERV